MGVPAKATVMRQKVGACPIKGMREFFIKCINPDSMSDAEYRAAYEMLIKAGIAGLTGSTRYTHIITRDVIAKCRNDERISIQELQVVLGLKYASTTNRLARHGESSKNLRWSTSKVLQEIIEKTW